MLDNRIKNTINITESQAGGRAGKATSDHLAVLNMYIQTSKKQKKPLFIAFLDVTKAYDKAWIDAIIYAASKSGFKGKNLRIMKNLNSNLTATIKTKYGDTRTITIKDSIRQGGVLTVVEYTNMMDEIAKQITIRDQGNQTLGETQFNGCLLWMDDVALIHNNPEELQAMLDTTNEIATRYHLTINNKENLDDHLTRIKSKSEAAYQTILTGKPRIP